MASSSPSPSSSSVYRQSIELTLGRVFSISEFLNTFDKTSNIDAVKVHGVFAISNSADETQYVGSSTEVVEDVKRCYIAHGPEIVSKVRVQTFLNHSPQMIEAFKAELVKQTNPWGNRMGSAGWTKGTEAESSGAVDDGKKLDTNASKSSSKLDALRKSVVELREAEPAASGDAVIQSPFMSSTSSSSASRSVVSLDNEFHLELTTENVDKVLDEIRPYLKADGGNVAVVGVDTTTRSVSLVLQGACGSCPSSTTTMKMGIERILKENFADLGPVVAVDPEGALGSSSANPESAPLLTVEAVSSALEKILPAIRGMGGSVMVESVDSSLGHVVLMFKGNDKLKKGVELVVKDVKYVKSVEMRQSEIM